MLSSAPAIRRGSRISARGGRQGIDDLIWDGDERFLTYANTYLQLFKVLITILCLNGVEQPIQGTPVSPFLPLKRRNPRLLRGSLRPWGGRRTQPLPLDPRLAMVLSAPAIIFFYKFSPNLLNGRIDETRARSNQSL